MALGLGGAVVGFGRAFSVRPLSSWCRLFIQRCVRSFVLCNQSKLLCLGGGMVTAVHHFDCHLVDGELTKMPGQVRPRASVLQKAFVGFDRPLRIATWHMPSRNRVTVNFVIALPRSGGHLSGSVRIVGAHIDAAGRAFDLKARLLRLLRLLRHPCIQGQRSGSFTRSPDTRSS